MKKGDVDFAAVKAQAGMRRVLERYGILDGMTEQGDRLSGPCPICEGDGPTQFRVSQGKNCYKCFRCEAGGNVLDFVAAMEQCSIREAASAIAKWFGIEGTNASSTGGNKNQLPKKREAPVKDRVPYLQGGVHDQPVASGENPPLTFALRVDPEHPWFAENSLLPSTVRAFGLGFCSKGMMAGRIVFPLRNVRGELVGYAGLLAKDDGARPRESWKYPKGLALDLVAFPIERITAEGPQELTVVRDPLEVVMLWQAGVTNAVSLPGTITLRTLGVLADSLATHT